MATLAVSREGGGGEGEKTKTEQLFSEIDLTCPDNISIEYSVVDDDLTAEISWSHSVPYLFSGLSAAADFSEDDNGTGGEA